MCWHPQTLSSSSTTSRSTQVLSRPRPATSAQDEALPDLRDIKGQEAGKRAGKWLRRAVTDADGWTSGRRKVHAGTAAAVHTATNGRARNAGRQHGPSLAGQLGSGLSRRRPFRAPHHSASMAALIGGDAKPGEMALAHHGVLFLDELPEFQPRALEALRQPMETGETVVARANYHVSLPARFQLVAAMNPCARVALLPLFCERVEWLGGT